MPSLINNKGREFPPSPRCCGRDRARPSLGLRRLDANRQLVERLRGRSERRLGQFYRRASADHRVTVGLDRADFNAALDPVVEARLSDAPTHEDTILIVFRLNMPVYEIRLRIFQLRKSKCFLVITNQVRIGQGIQAKQLSANQ